MKNKIKYALLTIVACALVVTFTACAGGKTDKDHIDVCEASEPQSIDPGLNTTVDGSTMISHLFSGLAQWKQNEKGEVVIKPELAKELPEPVRNADGTFTYTYHLIDNAKWTDGKPVTAQDFVFGWNRSVSVDLASDFSYMFEIVKGYDDIWADEPPADAKLDCKALDDKTFQVVCTSNVPYWNEFLAFPVFLPMREDVVDNEGMWATKPETFVSNGPYKLANWQHNSIITLEKTDTYPFADKITMPKINFYLSDNANNQLANFKTKDWEFIKDMPTNEIATLKREYVDEYTCDPQTGVYYISWQANFDLSPVGGRHLTEPEQAEVRGAINLLLDRNYITDYILQGGQKPSSSYVPDGIKDTDGKMFYQNAGKAGKPYYGYFPTAPEYINENYAKATDILKKYYTFNDEGNITDFPTMTYIYNTNEGHKAIAEYFQNVLAGLGIKMSLENQEWATFLTTKKTGNFTMCRNSWIADYNDPICFLDLHNTTSGNNASRLGRDGHANAKCYDLDFSDIPKYASKSVKGGTWTETYDVLTSLIKTEEDPATRNKLSHKAEDLLFKTNTTCPVYFYTHNYLLQKNVKGHFSNPLGIDYFMYATLD
ncbi:MAG: peptide ABC transporter substrate-binding protein [Coriobacteriia bacterium]|nr:peptide ABC transporter substrate-binding protein [Coriobacteriia bacterium]